MYAKQCQETTNAWEITTLRMLNARAQKSGTEIKTNKKKLKVRKKDTRKHENHPSYNDKIYISHTAQA